MRHISRLTTRLSFALLALAVAAGAGVGASVVSGHVSTPGSERATPRDGIVADRAGKREDAPPAVLRRKALPSGEAASPSFSLVVQPSPTRMLRGMYAEATITIVPHDGFVGDVGFSLENQPAGVGVTFSPNPASSTSTLRFHTDTRTDLGAYEFRIKGNGLTSVTYVTAGLDVLESFSPICPRFNASSETALTGDVLGGGLADLNRDGRVDLVLLSWSSDKLLLLPGMGDGTFGAATTLPGSDGPLAVVAADLNRDGRQDLAVTNSYANSVSVWLALGDGTFLPAVDYATGTGPRGVVARDFGGDGITDLAVANTGEGSVSVFEGAGDGTFATPINYAVGAGTAGLENSDLNRDGRVDLAVAFGNEAGSIAILLANGDGTFRSGVARPTGSWPRMVASGDVDRDGVPDLAVLSGAGEVLIHRGLGDGTFSDPVTYATGGMGDALTVVDVDDDARPDLVVSTHNESKLSLLRGRGDGTFETAVDLRGDWPFTLLDLTRDFFVADFDMDGKVDLGVSNYRYGKTFAVLHNSGDCRRNCRAFEAIGEQASGASPEAVVSADFDRDGVPDLAVADSAGNGVSVLLGNGDGTSAPAASYAAGSSPVSLGAADFGEDGVLDLAVANRDSGDVSILSGNADGTFGAPVSHACGTTPRGVVVGDLNRDGLNDLVVANGGSNDVSVLLGAGAGLFYPASSHAAGTNPAAVRLADVDRNGALDIVVANEGSGDVSLLRGNGDGTFLPAATFGAGDAPKAIAVADFDRDGRLDLAVANGGSGDLSILGGDGSGSFAAPIPHGLDAGLSGVVVEDFDEDGALDLVVTNASTNSISMLRGLGDLSFALTATYAAGAHPAGACVADFDRDGRVDVAVASAGAGVVRSFRNSCLAPDLTVTASHAGTFVQGERALPLTLTVSNVGAGPATGLVSVSDSLPAGLTASAMSGDGWSCAPEVLTCTREDGLASGASYPPVVVTVNVANDAPASMPNTASVSGGGDHNLANDQSVDGIAVEQHPDLIVGLSHVGTFARGETGQRLEIVVRNAGGLPTAGTVTVANQLPSGLTATAMAGPGWNCSLATLTCSRSDALARGASYPPVVLTVNVSASAPSRVVNIASAVGGGEIIVSNNSASETIQVWSMEGCETYRPSVPYLLTTDISNWTTALAVEVADLNRDGIEDFVTANRGGRAGISVFLGLGDGTFAPSTVFYRNYDTGRFVICDLNGDGILDIAVRDMMFPTGLGVLLGRGDGGFDSKGFVLLPAPAEKMVAGDFDGDGDPDLAITYSSTRGVSVLIGNGDGTLQLPVLYGSALTVAREMVTADFDGDRTLDLAVVSVDDDAIAILHGNGDGTFASPILQPVADSPDELSKGDLNEDGRADLVVGTSSGLWTLLGLGNGSFASPSHVLPAVTATDFEIEDLNGDGLQDLLAITSSGILRYFGNGLGGFEPGPSTIGQSCCGEIAVGDFDGDGRVDLVTTNSSHTASVMLADCADLEISKSHTGDFRIGQQDAAYSLSVRNVGPAVTSGTVTVTEQLPAGLSLASMSGSGWACSVIDKRCTRSTTLLPDSTYPPITVTVSVSSQAPPTVTNVATVSGGEEQSGANSSASDPTTITGGPDLVVTKTHGQAFLPGGTGSYTITVKNQGSQTTSGLVTVTDTLPAGLTATSIAGAGWSCNLASRSCTRSDALAANSSYPAIALTVSVAQNCAAAVTNVATVSNGSDFDLTNNNASDATVVLRMPVLFGATVTSTTTVKVEWNSVYGAVDYLVYRAVGRGSFYLIASTSSTSFNDSGLTPNTAYLYRMQPRSGSVLGPFSLTDSTITMLFTDDPLVAGSTTIKAVHFTELRAAVNVMRAAAGLSPASFTDPSLSGLPVRAIHYTQLWDRLSEARDTLGLVRLIYGDFPLVPGTPIRATLIAQLRNALK